MVIKCALEAYKTEESHNFLRMCYLHSFLTNKPLGDICKDCRWNYAKYDSKEKRMPCLTVRLAGGLI